MRAQRSRARSVSTVTARSISAEPGFAETFDVFRHVGRLGDLVEDFLGSAQREVDVDFSLVAEPAFEASWGLLLVPERDYVAWAQACRRCGGVCVHGANH